MSEIMEEKTEQDLEYERLAKAVRKMPYEDLISVLKEVDGLKEFFTEKEDKRWMNI